eukprot:jgi/Botrbrau1/1777/Bobra.0217s0032.1
MTASWRPGPFPGRALTVATLVLFVAVLAGIFADAGSQQAGTEAVHQISFIDIGQVAWVIAAQFLHASTSDIFPTSFLTLNPFGPKFKLEVCSRKEVAKCMYYGNSSNGLPPNLQGIWWTDGLGLPTVAASFSGPWDPLARKLRMGPIYARTWAFENTSSELVGLTWTASGASDFNTNLVPYFFFDIYLNEFFTYGQVVAGVQILGIPILLPIPLFNFQMEWLGDDTWQRKSSLFFLPAGSGNYFLRRAVTGEGKPGRWFNGFLKYKGPTESTEGFATPVPL